MVLVIIIIILVIVCNITEYSLQCLEHRDHRVGVGTTLAGWEAPTNGGPAKSETAIRRPIGMMRITRKSEIHGVVCGRASMGRIFFPRIMVRQRVYMRRRRRGGAGKGVTFRGQTFSYLSRGPWLEGTIRTGTTGNEELHTICTKSDPQLGHKRPLSLLLASLSWESRIQLTRQAWHVNRLSSLSAITEDWDLSRQPRRHRGTRGTKD